jgi:hypothetical protein
MEKPPKPKPIALGKETTGAQGASKDSQEQPLRPRPPKPPLPRTLSGPTARVRGLRVLIIDDDPAKLDALAMSLRDLKAEVAVGSRVESGYAQAAKLMPDVVISDLVSPGERGWWLVQRLRRHPILRWTPFILLRWWEETPSGEGRVLIERVLDRLEEALAPVRVLRERIANGRPLAGRIDTTGPQSLLRTLTASRITGVLTVNDAWSIFEATIGGGKLHSIVRRGVDGVVDEGEEALLQFLLCDTAKWSFRLEQKTAGPSNIDANLEKALGRTGRRIQDLFSRPKGAEVSMESLLRIRLDVLAAAAPTLSTMAQRISKAIGEGMSEAEIDIMLADIDDPFETERALHSLVRSGAVQPLDKAFEGNRSQEERKAAVSASYLLKRLCDDQSDAAGAPGREDGMPTPAPEVIEKSSKRGLHGGLYKASDLPEERLAVTMPGVLRAKNAHAQQTASRGFQTPDETPSLVETTSVLASESAAKASDDNAAEPADEAADKPKPGIFRRLLHDSLVPGPFSPEKRGDKQMWLAIALAALFGGLVVAGLIYLASGTPDEPPAPSDKF